MRILTDPIFVFVSPVPRTSCNSLCPGSDCQVVGDFKHHVRLTARKAQHTVQYNSAANEPAAGILPSPEQTL